MKKNEEAEDGTGRREKGKKEEIPPPSGGDCGVRGPAAVGREERRGPIRARRGEIQAAVGGVGNAKLVHAVHGRGSIHRKFWTERF